MVSNWETIDLQFSPYLRSLMGEWIAFSEARFSKDSYDSSYSVRDYIELPDGIVGVNSWNDGCYEYGAASSIFIPYLFLENQGIWSAGSISKFIVPYDDVRSECLKNLNPLKTPVVPAFLLQSCIRELPFSLINSDPGNRTLIEQLCTEGFMHHVQDKYWCWTDKMQPILYKMEPIKYSYGPDPQDPQLDTGQKRTKLKIANYIKAYLESRDRKIFQPLEAFLEQNHYFALRTFMPGYLNKILNSKDKESKLGAELLIKLKRHYDFNQIIDGLGPMNFKPTPTSHFRCHKDDENGNPAVYL